MPAGLRIQSGCLGKRDRWGLPRFDRRQGIDGGVLERDRRRVRDGCFGLNCDVQSKAREGRPWIEPRNQRRAREGLFAGALRTYNLPHRPFDAGASKKRYLW